MSNSAVFANGQTIVLNGNNCVIESLISMGSEAVVYKIQTDGKPYALKHYKPNTPLSETAKNILTKIRDNPKEKVVKIFDFGSYNDQDFEITEYAEGGTLGEYIRKNGSVRHERLKAIVKQINEGLQQLHEYYKIIHQNLKPENIFFTNAQGSSIVLANFGTSSVMQDGGEEVSPSVDYFDLGMTMYELWLGEQPFKQIKATTRERRIQNRNVDFPMDMPNDCKTLIQGLIDPLPKDRMGNEHVLKWLRGETLTLNNKPITGTDYKPLKFGSEFASNPKEMAALMEKYPDVGKDTLYDEIITDWLNEAGDLILCSEIKNVMSDYDNDREAGLFAAIYTLDPERPFVSRAGKTCKSNEEIAEAITADASRYMEDLKKPNAGLYIYIAATGGPQGKETANTFRKYFKEYSPNRALTLIYLKLQNDGGMGIGSKRYLSADELAQEKDGAQIDLIKKAVKEKDSQLLVWLSARYGDYFQSTEEFGKLGTPDQFFLLGILPFLSFKELTGNNGEAALQDLINFYPGRSDLFETYAGQGLPLKDSILDSPVKRNVIDYVVRNFDKLGKSPILPLGSSGGAGYGISLIKPLGSRPGSGSGSGGAGYGISLIKPAVRANIFIPDSVTILNLIRLLHKLGADVNECSSDGTCPLVNARIAKNNDLIDLLIELGAGEEE
jgi:serine/threonine-protein kinase